MAKTLGHIRMLIELRSRPIEEIIATRKQKKLDVIIARKKYLLTINNLPTATLNGNTRRGPLSD